MRLNVIVKMNTHLQFITNILQKLLTSKPVCTDEVVEGKKYRYIEYIMSNS